MRSRLVTNVILLIIALGLVAALLFEKAPVETTFTPIAPQLKPASISSITISRAGRDDAILNNTKGIWRMSSPVAIHANKFIIGKIADLPQLQSYNVIAADAAKLAEYGLETPQYSVTLNNLRMDFGEQNPITKRRYIKIDNQIHLINDDVSQILSGSPASLIAHQLIPENVIIEKIALPDITLHQQNGIWTSEPAPTETISQDTYNEFLDQWRLTQALHVSLNYDSTQSDKSSKSVEIYGRDQQIIRFLIDENTDDMQLVRLSNDKGKRVNIEYHLQAEISASILQFPPKR